MSVKALAQSHHSTSTRSAAATRQSKPLLQARAAESSSRLSDLIRAQSQSAPPIASAQSASAIQARLIIGAAHDSYEAEADRVADNVVSISSRKFTQNPSSAAPSQVAATPPAISRKSTAETESTQLDEQEKKEEEIQARFLQRGFMDFDAAPGDEDENIQARFLQPSADKTPVPGAAFEQQLNSSAGQGSALSSGARSEMESGIGADFSSVRIHSDSRAAQMSQQISARAFTHGGDIYFNQGQYQPQTASGRHLLAHELTHTVQQGAAPQRQAHISRVEQPLAQGKRIQRGWLGSAWSAVSGAASAAVEWAGDQIDRALNWAKDKFRDFVQRIPGYKLLSVILRQDPVTGAAVARNGRNFILAGLDVIPFGESYRKKLEQTGKMEEAASWLDGEIAKLGDISLSGILSAFSRFWSSLSLSDLRDIPGVLARAAAIIRNPVARVVRFAINIASKLLEIVKNGVLSSLVNFVRERTRAYPLLTVILRKDPITDEVVERNGMNLIRGFMLLSESGAEQLRQMQQSGALQRAADWIDGAVARLDLSWETIKGLFRRAWNLVSISSLLHPLATFQELFAIFVAPAGRILRFVGEVAVKILQLIKDALINRLVAYARTTRGYPLLTVILGRDPFSGKAVPRSTENIVHGFMVLKEGGEEQFQEMKSSGAIARLSARVEAAMALLNFTWAYIRGLFTRAWNSFSLSDLVAPFEAFARIMGLFAEPLMRLVSFVWQIIKIVIEVLLTMMRFPFALINNIITRAMEAIDDIKRDPIGFLKNLIRAVKQGFMQFFDRIGTHLINGVTGWLFGQLEDAGITPPRDLSFRSILGLVMQVLGITVDRIWSKLAERIGQDRVDRIRGMIDRLTGIWSFVKDVMQRGVVAIWEYIQDRLSNLWDMVLGAIRNWIVTRIIQRVTTKLLSMLDPSGIMAVINGFIAFYNAVQSFIQYLREMLEIVNSFVVGVAEIARGDVSRAANFLEDALARGISIAIGFLANQVGLGGLGRRIGEMIENVRSVVDRALDWLIDRAVSAGSALLNMGRNAIASVRNWWQRRNRLTTRDGDRHELSFQGDGGSARLVIASEHPGPYLDFIAELKALHNLSETDVSEARQKAIQIDQEKSSNRSDEEKAANIDTYFNQLVNLTRQIPIPSSGGASTEPAYGPLYEGNYGSLARVDKIAKDKLDKGSTADSSRFTSNYEILNIRKQGRRSFYVRGHLLSWHLGGPGNDWRNLTPLFQNVNANHESRFESTLKTALASDKTIEKFSVQAVYGRSASPYISSLRDMNDDTLPAGFNPAHDPEVVANLLEAELKVPTRLINVAEIVDQNGARTALSVPLANDISYANLSSYNLDGRPRVDFSFTEQVTAAGGNNRDQALANLMVLNGVGPRIAGKIVDRVESGRRITNFYRQISISRKYLQKLNPDKRIRQ
jgi:hypothetical protein